MVSAPHRRRLVVLVDEILAHPSGDLALAGDMPPVNAAQTSWPKRSAATFWTNAP